MAMCVQIRSKETKELLSMSKADDKIREILGFDPDPDNFSAFFWWWSCAAYFGNVADFNGPLPLEVWIKEKGTGTHQTWTEEEFKQVLALTKKVEKELEVCAWRN